MNTPNRPVVLLIIDGWGIAPPGPGNAVSLAKIPVMTKLISTFPHTQLLASGEAVGLPHGEDGNTETGHLNLGAGFIVYQDLPRINMSIADGSFFQNPAFLSAVNHVKKNQSSIHLLGLIGTGGVHSNLEHLFALLHLCKEEGLKNVFLHLFTDGRDSPPTSAPIYLKQVEEQIVHIGIGQIASISGRYYAMDRDNRWERTEKVYNALTKGVGEIVSLPQEAISNAYKRSETDEFIKPTLIVGNDNVKHTIMDNDAVIFFNFRVDRPRQLTKAFVLPDLQSGVAKVAFDPYAVKYFKKHIVDQPKEIKVFTRGPQIKNLFFVTMTEYEQELPAISAYPPEKIKNPLGKVISTAGLRQLHVSESEKERFVTYYFNGLREDPFPGESDVIIPSPLIATYDLKPEMSAFEITESLLLRIESRMYDFIIVNFANPDMVAHTGNIEASVKACEVVDECVGKIINQIIALDGSCIITSDHGNVEELINKESGGIDTEHSTYPVPFICASKKFQGKGRIPTGILADIAPTVLSLLGIPVPSDMSGKNLLQNII